MTGQNEQILKKYNKNTCHINTATQKSACSQCIQVLSEVKNYETFTQQYIPQKTLPHKTQDVDK